jgi:hypothetical protein
LGVRVGLGSSVIFIKLSSRVFRGIRTSRSGYVPMGPLSSTKNALEPIREKYLSAKRLK